MSTPFAQLKAAMPDRCVLERKTIPRHVGIAVLRALEKLC